MGVGVGDGKVVKISIRCLFKYWVILLTEYRLLYDIADLFLTAPRLALIMCIRLFVPPLCQC